MTAATFTSRVLLGTKGVIPEVLEGYSEKANEPTHLREGSQERSGGSFPGNGCFISGVCASNGSCQ